MLVYVEVRQEEDLICYGVQFSKLIENGMETFRARLGALNTIELKLPVPRTGGTAAEVGSVTTGRIPIWASNCRRELRQDLGWAKFVIAPQVCCGSNTTCGAMCCRLSCQDNILGPELAPATPTVEPEENLSGVKFFGPRHKNGPTRVNHRRRRYVIKVGGVQRILPAHEVPMRKPLQAVGDMLAPSHDVHVTAEGS